MSQLYLAFLLTITLVLAEQEQQTTETDDSTVDRNTILDTTKNGIAKNVSQGIEQNSAFVEWYSVKPLSSYPVKSRWGKSLGGEGELPTSMMHILTAAGALAVSVIGIAIILYLVLQPFGFRLCHLVGNCNDHTPYAYAPGYDSYSLAAGGGTYNQPLSYSSTNFQRRSLEYVGPILKALSAAYDKYAVPLIKKKE